MAVIPLNPTTFTLVDEAIEPVMIQFTGPGAIQVAQSADPADGDWITMDTNRAIEFPAGAPIYARAPNGGNVRAITRPFNDDAGGAPLPRLNATISPDPIVAGQQFTITFEDEPETATVTQDGEPLEVAGTGLSRTAIAPNVGVVTIDARKDGFRRFYSTRDVVEAPPAPVAPSVDATASISATGTVLDGPLDTVKGYPAPEPAFQWFDGDDPITGATGKSYDHGGADGAYRRQTTWTNGVGDPAVSTSNTITIAPAPGIDLVSLTPNPMVAGQPFTIVFNTTLAANEVTSSVTLSGTGDTRTGTAPADDTVNVSISATKTGWRPFSQAFDVQAPASQIVVLNGEPIIVNEPTADRTLDIIEPARFATTGLILTADRYTDGLTIVAEPVIERNNGAIRPTRYALFSYMSEHEPFFYGHDFYRGTTKENAQLIPDTDDLASYTEDPVVDGGKNIYMGVWAELAGTQGRVVAMSNPIAVRHASGWWNPHPNLIADIDYTNNRARINNQTFTDILDAESANFIKTLDTLKYIDIPNLSAFTIAARAPAARSTDTSQTMAWIDDGDDGNETDNCLILDYNSGGKLVFYVVKNGSAQTSFQGTTTVNSGTVKIAATIRGTSAHGNLNGEIFNDAASSAPAGTVRMGLFDKPFVSRPWRSEKGRIILINAAMTDAEIATLYGEL